MMLVIGAQHLKAGVLPSPMLKRIRRQPVVGWAPAQNRVVPHSA